MIVSQHNQRVIYSDNGVLEDITLKINDFRSGSFDLSGYVAGEDYIFVGSDLPFSHKYFDLSSLNGDSSTIAIEYWDGTQWESVVDILDETLNDAGAATLSKNGVISWKTNKDENLWACEEDSKDVDGLTGTVIHYMYWLRISFSGSLTAGTTLQHLGYLFNTDDELYSMYPDFNNTRMLDAFERMDPTGTKTDWKEQSLIAACQIIRRMRSSRILWTPAQILDFQILQEAGIHKTAEIIYTAMGEPYESRRKLAQEKFSEAFNLNRFNLDMDKNARLDDREKVLSTTFMSR